MVCACSDAYRIVCVVRGVYLCAYGVASHIYVCTCTGKFLRVLMYIYMRVQMCDYPFVHEVVCVCVCASVCV